MSILAHEGHVTCAACYSSLTTVGHRLIYIAVLIIILLHKVMLYAVLL